MSDGGAGSYDPALPGYDPLCCSRRNIYAARCPAAANVSRRLIRLPAKQQDHNHDDENKAQPTAAD